VKKSPKVLPKTSFVKINASPQPWKKVAKKCGTLFKFSQGNYNPMGQPNLVTLPVMLFRMVISIYMCGFGFVAT
jgi:hypothetical protein